MDSFLSGMTVGAGVGSIWGPVGTIIGAPVGGILGAVMALMKGKTMLLFLFRCTHAERNDSSLHPSGT